MNISDRLPVYEIFMSDGNDWVYVVISEVKDMQIYEFSLNFRLRRAILIKIH